MFEQRAACVPEDIVIAVRLLEPSIRAASPPDFSWTGSRECRLLPRSGRCDGAAACQGGAIRVACRGDFPAKGCRGATSIQLPSRISPNLFSLSVVWRTFHALPSTGRRGRNRSTPTGRRPSCRRSRCRTGPARCSPGAGRGGLPRPGAGCRHARRFPRSARPGPGGGRSA